jgi:hypothetical protein
MRCSFLALVLVTQQPMLAFAQAKSTERVRLDAIHRVIGSVLQSTNSLAWKRQVLSPFVKIGDTAESVSRMLGRQADRDGYGPGFARWFYGISGLHLTFYPDGICTQIEYVGLRTKEYVLLAGPRELFWPRKNPEHGQPTTTSTLSTTRGPIDE